MCCGEPSIGILVVDLQFSGLGYDPADFVHIDTPDISKLIDIFNICANDLLLGDLSYQCTPRTCIQTEARVEAPFRTS